MSPVLIVFCLNKCQLIKIRARSCSIDGKSGRMIDDNSALKDACIADDSVGALEVQYDGKKSSRAVAMGQLFH